MFKRKLVRICKKLLFGTHLVSLRWRIRLALLHLFTDKIKVGFGPITTGDDDFAERKWRIDPVINELNQCSSKYAASYFIKPKEMRHFDLVVIVKKFNPRFVPVVERLKKQGKRFIYDIVDNPNCEKKYRYYFADHQEFSGLMDGFILSNPLQKAAAERFSKATTLIEHPIINTVVKEKYPKKKEIVLLAHGYYANLENLKSLEPLLREISNEIDQKIVLLYHSEVVFPDTEWVRYVKWSVKNCFTVMLEADIAITIKNLHLRHQRTKPSTKVVAFMAAGLPVICMPTVADRLVINHGVDGFFAYTTDDWRRYIKMLAKSSHLREQIGRAAKKRVNETFSISQVTRKYEQFFDQLI
jgi:glycosyltransferase involved in cell wall biosynthesis